MGIVSDGLPAWLFLTDNLTNCQLQWLTLPDNQQHWENLVPKNTEIRWLSTQPPTKTDAHSIEDVLMELPACDVVVFEGKYQPPRASSEFWKRSTQVVLAQRSLRGKSPSNWAASSRALNHAQLGGVTNWSCQFHVWTRKDSESVSAATFWEEEILQGADSSFEDLLDKKQTGKRVREDIEPSSETNKNQVDCETIQKKRKKLWTLPTVFGSMRTKRRLTVSEVSSCLDVPSSLAKTMNESTSEVVVRELTSPIKVAAAIGACLVEWTKKRDRINEEEDDGYKFPSIKRSRLSAEMTVNQQKSELNAGTVDPVASIDSASSMSRGLFRRDRLNDYRRPKDTGVDTTSEKAVKHDKAAVPVDLWDDRVRYLLGHARLQDNHRRAFAILRSAMLRRWKRNVIRSWVDWWNKNIKYNEPRWWKVLHERGWQACRQAFQADFWSWPAGSGVFFWRWPQEYIRDVALGVPPLWTGVPRQILEPQQGLGDEETITKIKEKLDDVRLKKYVGPGQWKATMNYFAVPKGETDIRMVYDGTKSGLNDCLYAPWFPLPDADVLVRTLDDSYWCVDNDYGEMFLNFWIHPELQEFSGMDLTPLFRETETGELYIEGWYRCPMGQSPSPFNTVQQTRRLKRVMMGDPSDEENVFRWSSVRVNLPGTVDYQPGVPWIAKYRSTGELAADAHDYVDDLRGTGPTAEDAWQVSSRIAKTASFHGVQDAARKRREQTQSPGAWAGVVCGTEPRRPYKTVSQEKWEKTKKEVGRLREEMDQLATATPKDTMNSKTLEQVAGFLNHVGRAFPVIRIYLNGVYATLNSWRPDRDDEGWKIGSDTLHLQDPLGLETPKRVRMVSRMRFDIEALESLTSASSPPRRMLRPDKQGATVRYFFGDASGAGFGMSGWTPGDHQVEVDFGAWDPKAMQGSSSNFRELANIVMKIEQLSEEDRLNSLAEVFIFTDNMHAESAFYRGTAKSPEVLSLMFRLHRVLMKGEAFIHFVWVAGKRMITQGTDGLSRSDLTSGVMRGDAMLDFVPLHLTVDQRQPRVISSLLRRLVDDTDQVHVLKMNDWFSKPTDNNGVFVWLPPPCLADVAVFTMAEAWHVRPWNTHIFIAPSLMSGRWRRMLAKAVRILTEN